MPPRTLLPLAFCLSAALALPAAATPPDHSEAGGRGRDRPNILFIILDDVGIDQMALFNPYDADLPPVPNIDQIARQGMTFSQTWAMPECSPSRATFFTGRFPIRTGVTSAILEQMLPQAQVSPYETTLPRLLRTVGYASAMVGKYHLGNQNPSGNCSPATRGFDHFDGNMEAGPPSIDHSAGHDHLPPNSGNGVGPYTCGFVREEVDTPAGPVFEPQMGACYFEDGSCKEQVTGKQCLQDQGLLALQQTCDDQTASRLHFENYNGYYVWPDTANEGFQNAPVGCSESGYGCAELSCGVSGIDSDTDSTLLPTNREYMTTYQTDASASWWNAQSGPRMLTVSYNSIHTPYQQVPTSDPDDGLDALQCTDDRADEQQLADAMLENMDAEIGVLLHKMGLASLRADGTIRRLHLRRENTLLVIIGDNGTYATAVKPPFSPLRAKGSVFQTGAWVPLVVAGPQVKGRRGRDVDALINSVDLFELFAEVAGLDPREILPPAHPLDSQPMLPYLEDRKQEPIRGYNFTQLQPEGTLPFPLPADPKDRLWPCVLFSHKTPANAGGVGSPPLTNLNGGTCQDLLFDTRSFCQSNGGFWFGPGSPFLAQNGGQPWQNCCEVLAQFPPSAAPDSGPPGVAVSMSPVKQFAVRNDDYKLGEFHIPDCNEPDPTSFPPFENDIRHGFYELITPPQVDYEPLELCKSRDQALPPAPPNCTYDGGSKDCPLKCEDGTGNHCGNAPACLLTQNLRDNYDALFGTLGGIKAAAIECPGDGNLDKRVTQLDLQGVRRFAGAGKSYYDVNKDGKTDSKDALMVQANLGTDCLGPCLGEGCFPCRRADLNHDNVVNQRDVEILRRSRGACDVDLAAEAHLCAADLNGDGVVDDEDLEIMRATRRANRGQSCPIVVFATGDPVDDPANVQAALDEGVLLGNGRVQLVGEFNFTECTACVKVRGPVLVQGTGDPSGLDDPDPSEVTVIHGASADPSTGFPGTAGPFLIRWDEDYFEGTLRIEKLWFKGGVAGAVIMEEARGVVELYDNRVTELQHIVFGPSDEPRHDFPFRFGLAGAGFGPFRGQLNGEFRAVGNHVDTRALPFPQGDDNGIAISATNFSFVDISHNTIYTRGESIEIENNIGPDGSGRIRIVGNDIITEAAISDFAKWADPIGFRKGLSGGHPATIKVAGGQVDHLLVRDNTVQTSGYPSNVCIMVGLNNEDSEIEIRNNRCSMDGQFAAILAGWAGEEPFFPPFDLHNARVTGNVFEGTARFGIVFMNWTFSGPVNPMNPTVNNLFNEGHDNVFRRNDMSGLRTREADLVFSVGTHDNVFVGNLGPNQTVINRNPTNSITITP